MKQPKPTAAAAQCVKTHFKRWVEINTKIFVSVVFKALSEKGATDVLQVLRFNRITQILTITPVPLLFAYLYFLFGLNIHDSLHKGCLTVMERRRNWTGRIQVKFF